MNQNILDMVSACVREVGETFGHESLKHPVPETRLYGAQGPLDSIGLVNLILAVEEKILAETGISLTLANDSAMSETHSPFRSLRALVHFCEAQLDAARKAA